jgi:exonuclease V
MKFVHYPSLTCDKDEIKAVWLQASLPGSPQQGQTRLEQHFQGMRVTRSKSRQTNSKVLQLKMSDTKTRRTNTLPPHSDTLSARLQLMLYRNMLEGLVSQKPPFNFEHLCADQKLDSSQKFSDSFIAAASLLIVANDIDSKAGVICSLGELFDLWRTALGGTEGERIEVSTELRLVYRRQFMEQRKLVIPLKQQDEALSSTATSEVVIGENSTILEGQGDHTPGAQELDSRKDVIGTKKFQYSDQFLEQHMSSMFDWWEGRREPEGVKHENIHRCQYAFFLSCKLFLSIPQHMRISRWLRMVGISEPFPELNDSSPGLSVLSNM